MKTEVYVSDGRVFVPVDNPHPNPVGEWFIDCTVPAKCFIRSDDKIVLKTTQDTVREVWDTIDALKDDVTTNTSDHRINPAVEIT